MWLCGLVGCSGGATTTATLAPLPGTAIQLAFDSDNTPHLATDAGLFRLTGDTWERLPLDGLPTIENHIANDRSGTLFVRGGGMVFRWPSGAAAWEPINPPPAPNLSSLPSVTSSGTYYAVSSGPDGLIAFKRATDTSWLPTGTFAAPTARWFADDADNLWLVDHGEVKRVHESESEIIDVHWGRGFPATEISVTGIAGNKLYGQPNTAVQDYGVVFAWDTQSRTSAVITDGTKCRGSGSRRCNDDAPFGLGSTALGPDGTAYEMRPDKFALGSLLFRLDGDTWIPIAEALDGESTVVVDPQGIVYVMGTGTGGSIVRISE